jgi:integrase
VGELINLKIGDIDWDEAVWRLNNTKTRCGRLIPIPPDDLIKMKYLIKNRSPDDYLFINPRSLKKMTLINLGVNFRRRIKEAQIHKHATIHTLRHSFITELMR